jgi:hypothetical protein
MHSGIKSTTSMSVCCTPTTQTRSNKGQFLQVHIHCQHCRHKQVRSIDTLHVQFIQGVINKFRDCFCNSVRERSWVVPLCWHVTLSLLSPRHKGRPETLRQYLASSGRTSSVPVLRRISVRAQNIRRVGTAHVHQGLR